MPKQNINPYLSKKELKDLKESQKKLEQLLEELNKAKELVEKENDKPIIFKK